MNKLKNLFASAKNNKLAVSVASVAVLGASNASAAIPEAVGTALAEVQTDGLAMADLIWPVVAALFGAALLFKLFKRFGNKI